ncbi:MAG: hypothetical protein KDD11_21140 [Acidobacteria bacterium]|nr:hypothetical protein [Acidobacteriota bacterium]
MKRPLGPVVMAAATALLCLVALVAQVRESLDRRLASRLLARAEAISIEVLSAGQAPRAVLSQNLRDLERARRLDPLEVGVPLALGSQYLLLRRPQEAEAAYRDALTVEPRPEIYLNLGKAQLLAGERSAADQSFHRAAVLDWHMREQIPAH